jgi:uncharacterized protein YacL
MCLAAGWLVSYVIPDWHDYTLRAMFIGGCLGSLVVLLDMLLKGFSLRGMSALTFGLFIGWVAAKLITASPLMEFTADPNDSVVILMEQNIYLVRLAIFVVLMYLGAVLALRGKDEFNLVIPYVRFVPHGVDTPLVVLDTSALIDGRIVGICESRFMGYGIVIPRFVMEELGRIADAADSQRQAKGRKGLESLRRLREMKHLDLRINESSVGNRDKVEDKLIFLAQSLKARLLTTDFNLAQITEFHNVECLNLQVLVKALRSEIMVGERIEIKLVKGGKEDDQAIGFLSDGSMVVVTNGRPYINNLVTVEVKSILPSAGGKMIFAQIPNVE